MSPCRADVGVAVLALLAASPRALADRCAPTARVTGEDVVVQLVTAELQRLGVALGGATNDCPSVDAQVRGDGHGGIAVTLRDGNRSDDRDVGAPAVVAAWIDAWLRDDLEWRTEATPPVPAVLPPGRVAVLPDPREHDDSPPDRVSGEATPGAGGLLARLSVAAGYEQAWTGDGAAWRGFGAAACLHEGAWCFGARARLATQDFSTGQTGVARGDVSALATASYTVALGQMAVAPELGVGVGRLTTSRAEACGPMVLPQCDPTDPNAPECPPPPAMPCGTGDGAFVGDNLRAASITPRGSAALRVEIPLFAHVWLDGVAALGVAPFGHAEPYAAMRGAPGLPPAQLALPGDPLTSFQLGIGLRVGAP